MDFAARLLKVKAVKIQPNHPFTWVSGLKSPLYCDNRKVLSYQKLRTYVKVELSHIIQDEFRYAQAIAAVATGAIPMGTLVADTLNLPFVYVRSKAKAHGLENVMEGRLRNNQKVVVVEDLVSTGGSSLRAVEALRAAGHEVIGMVALFTYGLDIARQAFDEAGVRLVTLTDIYNYMEVLEEKGKLPATYKEVLNEWHEDPEGWSNKFLYNNE